MLDSAVFIGLGFFLLTSGLVMSITLMIISRNKQLDGFMLLSGSDTLATLATGLLLIMTHFQIEGLEQKLVECNNEQLAMPLSIFTLPVITTLGSMPFWFLQMYQYTKKRCPPQGVKNYTDKKKAFSFISIQWLIQILIVLSIFKTEPEVMKMKSENSIWQRNSLFSFNMGDTYCTDLGQETDNKIPRSVRVKQLGKLQNISDLTSYIVERVYNIVEKSNNNKTENEIDNSTNDLTVYIQSINNILQKGVNETDFADITNNILNKHNSTVYHASNIGNLLTKTLGRLPETRDESTLGTTDFDKIVSNFLAGMHKSHYNNKKQSTQLLQNNAGIMNLMENIIQANRLNNFTNNTTQCISICQPSRTFLKNLFFGLLFMSFFIPISASILLQAKTNSKIDQSEANNPNHDKKTVDHLKKVISLLVKTALTSGMMVSPSLIESSVRSLISNDIPQCVSKLLFVLAQVGMIIRNIAGVQMVKMTCNKRSGDKNNSQVHPEAHESNESTDEIEQQPSASQLNLKPQIKE